VAVDYSNGTEVSWYLSAWVTCQTLDSRAVVDGSLEVGTVGMRKATASCRALRAEQARNGEGYTVAVFVCSETLA
jgi:hypothetical protein